MSVFIGLVLYKKKRSLNDFYFPRSVTIFITAITSRCFMLVYKQWRTEGGLGGSNTSLPEIPKANQNRAKFNPIVKTVKNC